MSATSYVQLMYMALHIADPEVSELMNQYVAMTGMTKTEVLRRLLREAILSQKRTPKRRGNFEAVSLAIIIKKNRKLQLPPQTKEEADSIFE